jgi:hypothetical protein
VADLLVAVVPRASADRIGPYRDGVLRVRVTRPPADGAANQAVVRLVARALGIAPGRVSIASGASARRKRLTVAGIEPAELERRLARIGAD